MSVRFPKWRTHISTPELPFALPERQPFSHIGWALRLLDQALAQTVPYADRVPICVVGTDKRWFSAHRRAAVKRSSLGPIHPSAVSKAFRRISISAQAASAAAGSSLPRICWIGLADVRMNLR